MLKNSLPTTTLTSAGADLVMATWQPPHFLKAEQDARYRRLLRTSIPGILTHQAGTCLSKAVSCRLAEDREDEEDEEEQAERPHGDMYVKWNAGLYGQRNASAPQSEPQPPPQPPLSAPFMKKFFIYAKQRCR